MKAVLRANLTDVSASKKKLVRAYTSSLTAHQSYSVVSITEVTD